MQRSGKYLGSTVNARLKWRNEGGPRLFRKAARPGLNGGAAPENEAPRRPEVTAPVAAVRIEGARPGDEVRRAERAGQTR